MSETKNEFWRFSIALWDQQPLRSCLMALQNELGLDINLALFATWCASKNLSFEGNHPLIMSKAQQWSDNIVKPIRQIRELCKQSDATSALYTSLLDTELQAEKYYQEALFELSHQLTPSKSDKHATLVSNLSAITDLALESDSSNALVECLSEAIK